MAPAGHMSKSANSRNTETLNVPVAITLIELAGGEIKQIFLVGVMTVQGVIGKSGMVVDKRVQTQLGQGVIKLGHGCVSHGSCPPRQQRQQRVVDTQIRRGRAELEPIELDG